MIFQEPMTSLNPCFTVGFQIMETLQLHEGGTRASAAPHDRAARAGRHPGAGDAAVGLPHQMSGGMNQRVMIAMAIACNPRS
jgi:dipeptide transport system ATP-binding protein